MLEYHWQKVWNLPCAWGRLLMILIYFNKLLASQCKWNASACTLLRVCICTTTILIISPFHYADYLTFLCFQKDDLRAVVNYLRADGNVSLIGLWGRSMGAVTRSLLFIIHFFIRPYIVNKVKEKSHRQWLYIGLYMVHYYSDLIVNCQ